VFDSFATYPRMTAGGDPMSNTTLIIIILVILLLFGGFGYRRWRR
jgi:LPXTG-motif cell wall-anchored protein